MELKHCRKCQQEKSLDEFYKDKGKPDGKTAHCKTCMNDTHNRYIAQHREEWNAYTLDRFLDNSSVNYGETIMYALAYGATSLKNSSKKYIFDIRLLAETNREGSIEIKWVRRDKFSNAPLDKADARKCKDCGKVKSIKSDFYIGRPTCKWCLSQKSLTYYYARKGVTSLTEGDKVIRVIENKLKTLKRYSYTIEPRYTDLHSGKILVRYRRG